MSDQRIRALLRVLADDLASEIDARYPAHDRRKYPSEEARYQRDMGIVHEAYELLNEEPTEIGGIDRRPSNVWKCEP